ncbi:LPXTG cell wall anchor domain-containing protein [Candidatus Woesearchaeota archaeon]|nr:LPXTG cell wall anchor domain-containing protein [Candidatus Woesearchaeota archaeon]
MRKILAILAVLILSAVSVLGAMDVTVNPDNIGLPDDGSTVAVDVKVTGSSSYPRPLVIDSWCKEVSGDPDFCDASDVLGTSEISVSVDAWTDSDGNAQAHLNWNGPEMGTYHYTVCVADSEGGSCIGAGAEVTGDAYIPEMTVLGSLAALGFAGVYIAKRRKQK